MDMGVYVVPQQDPGAQSS